jgi:hypothetical protein
MTDSSWVVEDVIDSDESRRSHIQDNLHRRNPDWLQAHWLDVLPRPVVSLLPLPAKRRSLQRHRQRPGRASMTPTRRIRVPSSDRFER